MHLPGRRGEVAGAEAPRLPSTPPAGDSAGDGPIPAQRSRSANTFAALRIRSFRWLFISTMIGVIGYQMQAVALGWLVYLLTGSAFKLGLITAVQALSQLLVSPMAGVIADRVERRNYIMLVRLVTVVVGAATTALIAIHQIQYWELVIGAGIIGIGFGLNGPARQALLADLVGTDYLLNAISLNSGGMNVMRIVGPAIAGFLIGVIGIGGVFGLNTCLFALVIIAMIPVPRRFGTSRRAKAAPLAELSGGVRYVTERRPVLFLLLFGTLPLFFAMPYVALLPIFATTVWHSGAEGFGLLSSAPGVGGLLGALWVASHSDTQKKGLYMLAGAVAYGVLLTAFALAPSMLIALPLLMVVGAASIVYTAVNSTLVQMLTTNEMRGRVMSFYQMSFGLGQFGALPASAVAQAFGAPLAVAGGGVMVVLISLGFARLAPVLREL